MSSKQPPFFNPENDTYENWKKDIEVWRLLADDKVKKGPAVYLSLQGDARSAVRHLKPADLVKDNGVDLIIKELDKVYIKDETARTFHAIRNVIEFRREAGQSFTKFMVEFNSRFREFETFNIVVPDSLKAYFLIKAANLSEEHERLVRATAQMKSEDMEQQLNKVFGQYNEKDQTQEGVLPIKEECLYGAAASQRNYKSGQGNKRNWRYDNPRRNDDSWRREHRGEDNWRNERRGEGNWRNDHRSDRPHKQNKDNPKDEDGNVMRCHECDSKKHLVRQCPHRDRKNEVKVTTDFEEIKAVNVTLVTENLPHLQDGLGKGILDCGCTKTVAGEVWMSEYINQLDPESRKKIENKISSATYRFGDGKEAKSIKQVRVPLQICDQEVSIWVDVVRSHIPLLIGLPTMSDLGLVIDTGNHEIISNGNVFPLDINFQGHYELSVLPNKVEEIYITDQDNEQNRKQMAIKLHRQFAHPSKERLIKLLKQSQLYDATFYKVIETVTDNCQFCLNYKAPKLKPIVAFSKATDYNFNQVVAMDLKEIKKGQLWILHMEDVATCYTAATIVTNKKKETIVRAIFKIWLAYFGAPEKFHSDCGREFNNDLFRDMNDLFNIETSTTPGESPYSNGKVERANKLLYETMMKTKEDTCCDYETALAWAVSAKNCLQSHLGYSPNMLVFGKNVNLPMISNSSLPALETNNMQDVVRSNLNALHKARENFVKAEASERIKRALRHKTRTYCEVEYSAGEKVLFKRRNEKRWRGPGIVLGKDSNFILIRHGAQIYRCHPCQLLKQLDKQRTSDKIERHKSTNNRNMTNMEQLDHNARNDISDSDDHDDDENIRNQEQLDHNARNDISDSDDHDDDENMRNLENTDNLDDINNLTQNEDENMETQENMEILDDMNSLTQNADNEHREIQQSISKIPRMLRRLAPHNKTGTKENTNCQSSLITETQREELQAKLEELNKLDSYDVFELVEDQGQQTVSCKWLIKRKDDKMKARLVARGFEENFQDRKDSPTCTRESLRLTFAIAATMGWTINTMDISSAFLQGNVMEREVFIKPPRESKSEGKLWKLKRCLYGLVDAPREWYQRVSKEMMQLGGKKSLYDKCLFVWHDKDSKKLTGILVAHVDDFQYCGTTSFQKVINRLKEIFKISNEEQSNYRYIGVNVRQEGDMTIKIDQKDYCKDLKEIPIQTSRKLQANSTLTEEEKAQLKSTAGKIQWATSQTRPEMAYHTCQVSNSGKNPCVKLLNDANKTVRKLKLESTELTYPPLGNTQKLTVVVYADGSHASLPSGGSQGGCIVFLVGDNGNAAPIAWRSKRIDRVTKSPLATEISAVADGSDVGFLVASMVKEIFELREVPVIQVRTDSKSLRDHLGTDKVIKDPRLRVDVARLRQMVDMGELVVTWVPGNKQLADCLTKRGAPNDMLKACLSSGVLPCE